MRGYSEQLVLVPVKPLQLVRQSPWIKGTSSFDSIPTDAPKLKARSVPGSRFAGIFERFGSVQALDIDDPRDLDATSLVGLGSLERLTWLRINRSQLSNVVAAAVGACGGLRHLELAGSWTLSSFDDAGLEPLGGLDQLEMLLLRGLQLDGKGVKALKGLSSLQTLEISSCRAKPALKPLKGLPIRRLILDSTSDIMDGRRKGRLVDASLREAALLPELRYLSARWCPKITGKGLVALAEDPKLQELVLTSCQKVATVEGMEAVAAMPPLLALDLGWSLNTKGDQVEALAGSGTLRALRLDVAAMQPGDLAKLAGLGTLQHLLLEHTLPRGRSAPITAEDILAIAGLPLRTLQLPQSTVVDTALVEAIAKTSVQHLLLDRNSKTPVAIETLAPLADAADLRTLAHFSHPDPEELAKVVGCPVLEGVAYYEADLVDPGQPLRAGLLLDV